VGLRKPINVIQNSSRLQTELPRPKPHLPAGKPASIAVGWVEVARIPAGLRKPINRHPKLFTIANRVAATEAPPEHQSS
jgi:hypothetical protein